MGQSQRDRVINYMQSFLKIIELVNLVNDRLTVVYETKRNEICTLRNLLFAKSVICEICSLRNLQFAKSLDSLLFKSAVCENI